MPKKTIKLAEKKRTQAQIDGLKKRTGRKTKIDRDDIIDPLMEALALGMPRDLACDLVGLHRDTFYDYLAKGQKELERPNADPENLHVRFLYRVRAAEAKQVHHDLSVIQKATEEAEFLDQRANIALKRLERRHPKHFGKRVDLTSGDQPIKAIVGINPDEV